MKGSGDIRSTCSLVYSRRQFLLAAGSAAFLATYGSSLLVKAQPAVGTAHVAGTSEFLALSQALTGKHDLNPATAARMLEALAKVEPEVHAQLPALTRLAATAADPTALVEAAGPARPAALAIIAAWYTGTVGTGIKAVTVAYRDALMQRPADDGLSPPTYAFGGPAWWVAPAPAPIRAQA
jgi:hypothetical protein